MLLAFLFTLLMGLLTEKGILCNYSLECFHSWCLIVHLGCCKYTDLITIMINLYMVCCQDGGVGFSVYFFINQLFSAFYKWQYIFSVSIHIFNRYLLNTYFVAFAVPDTEHFSGENIVSSPHIQKYGYRGGEVNT